MTAGVNAAVFVFRGLIDRFELQHAVVPQPRRALR